MSAHHHGDEPGTWTDEAAPCECGQCGVCLLGAWGLE